MYDRDLALEILRRIQWSTQKILTRTATITSVDNFTSSDFGMEKLDAVCMQLIASGENLKNLDKVTQKSLLPRYPQIAWKQVIGMRDVISHHYFDVDADVVFTVCNEYNRAVASGGRSDDRRTGTHTEHLTISLCPSSPSATAAGPSTTLSICFSSTTSPS